MASLFSGLEAFGLGDLEKKLTTMQEEEANKEKALASGAKVKAPEVTESDLLFDKTYNCPVCDSEFTTKMIRTGKVKLLGADTDLRPRYQHVDCIKYDAILCPKCGYAALSRFFDFMMPRQAKMIKENISANYRHEEPDADVFTYDVAIGHYKMALANTIVKKGKLSERAYVCLKLAWLCRGKSETLPKDTENYNEVIKQLADEEKELLSNAYSGFLSAFSKESFPMCGMDENTLTYLCADLARRIGKYEESSRWISKVLIARDANERIKNKAREIKELLQKEMQG